MATEKEPIGGAISWSMVKDFGGWVFAVLMYFQNKQLTTDFMNQYKTVLTEQNQNLRQSIKLTNDVIDFKKNNGNENENSSGPDSSDSTYFFRSQYYDRTKETRR